MRFRRQIDAILQNHADADRIDPVDVADDAVAQTSDKSIVKRPVRRLGFGQQVRRPSWRPLLP